MKMPKNKAELERLLLEAYCAGFDETGEGCNGEYRRVSGRESGNRPPPAIEDSQVRADFATWFESHE